MKVTAIVPSAGSGKRMYSKTDKPFIKLCKKEIIYYALSSLENSPAISEIIIAAKSENIPSMKKLIEREGFKKVRGVVAGGRERPQSVFNALSKVSNDTDYVLVHDGARPFITQGLIRKTIRAAKIYGASLTAVRVSPTIKESDADALLVKKTIDRRFLWEAQTPQVIRKDILFSAYKKIGPDLSGFTDESSMVENLGEPVGIVEGDSNNIKITTPTDLLVAEAILKKKKRRGCRV